MQKEPTVSIVLPTFNGSRYLRESIDSVLAQTLQDWELIIVDDASTDETPEIAQSYAARDPRIRVIHNARNLKLPASLNVGFKEASGRYWTWTSDDNRMRPIMLEKLASFLDTNPQFGMVCTGFTYINEAGRPVKQRPAGRLEDMLSWNAVGACFLYRRELAERVGEYCEECYLAEDYDYWLRVMAVADIAFLDADLYEYRAHESSLSSLYSWEISEASQRARHRAILAFQRQGKRSVAARLALTLGLEEAVRKGRKELLRAALFAMLCSPVELVRSGAGRHVIASLLLGMAGRKSMHAGYMRIFKREYGKQSRAAKREVSSDE